MGNLSLPCPCQLTWQGHAPATEQDLIHDGLPSSCVAASRPPPPGFNASRVAEVVVSHCSMDLAWLRDELSQLERAGLLWVGRVTVYSKCGKPVVNASAWWAVQVLPNVGRNDHTYAHHIATSHGCLLPTVLFLKDRMAAGWSEMKNRAVSLESMAHLVASAGFSCGFGPANADRIAAFHWSATTASFYTVRYKTSSHKQVAARSQNASSVPCSEWAQHRVGGAVGWVRATPQHRVMPESEPPRSLTVTNCTEWRGRRDVGFKSGGMLLNWLNGSKGAPASVAAELLQRPLWQMCYGGSFAARRSEIVSWPHALWRWMADSLSRSDNIAEGHYAERLWGALLAPQLSAERREAMLCATEQVRNSGGYYGMLIGCACRPKCGKYASMVREGPGRPGAAASNGVGIAWRPQLHSPPQQMPPLRPHSQPYSSSAHSPPVSL